MFLLYTKFGITFINSQFCGAPILFPLHTFRHQHSPGLAVQLSTVATPSEPPTRYHVRSANPERSLHSIQSPGPEIHICLQLVRSERRRPPNPIRRRQSHQSFLFSRRLSETPRCHQTRLSELVELSLGRPRRQDKREQNLEAGFYRYHV